MAGMRRFSRGPRLGIATLLVLGALISSCSAPNPPRPRQELEISLPDSAISKVTLEQLQKRASSTSVAVSNSPEYKGMALSFRVVPMSDLLPARYAREDLSVVFECLDGFAATIPAVKVLSTAADRPRAFLAMEDPSAPWPKLKEHPETTAGPFYLVWTGERPGQVIPEEWPYQIKRIAVRTTQEEFRGIVPETEGEHSTLHQGFQVFVRNCSPCHTLNGVGNGRIGPDLNVPMNPTEYFKEGIFENYVRDPRSVRTWPDQRMPSFPPDVLSDTELASLHAYLATMAGRKAGAPPTGK